MIIQILDHITEEIKQIRVDVFMKEQGFEDEFDKMLFVVTALKRAPCQRKYRRSPFMNPWDM